MLKGIVLMGGTGSRLGTLCKTTNKHLLPVGKNVMGEYPLSKMQKIGIKDVMIITGKDHAGNIISHFGSGEEYNLRIQYRVQERPGGIAEAISLTEPFIGKDDQAFVILGDNIFEYNFTKKDVTLSDNDKAKIFIYELESERDPRAFGCLCPKTKKIVEKPAEIISRAVVTGAYCFGGESLFQRISELEYSNRGELEVTDLNNSYAKDGKLEVGFIQGKWTDTGSLETLAEAQKINI